MRQWKNSADSPKAKHKSFYYFLQSAEWSEKSGPITNEDILENPDTYCTSDDPSDIYNCVLRPNVINNIDYKLINTQQWEFLYSRYSGVPIKRLKCQKHKYSPLVPEIHFQKINVIILPEKESFCLSNQISAKTLYISKHSTFNDLKERIVKVFNSSKYKYNLGAIRLWTSSLGASAVISRLKAQANKVSAAGAELVEDEVEKNEGVDFPGLCLELLGKCMIGKYDITDSTEIFAEQANADEKFIFRYHKRARVTACSYCGIKRPTTIHCACKEVAYCSAGCRDKDRRCHKCAHKESKRRHRRPAQSVPAGGLGKLAEAGSRRKCCVTPLFT